MKLKDWIELNENSYSGDLIILALKAGSYKKDDQLFHLSLSKDLAKILFGEHEIKCFRAGRYPNSEFYGIEVLIWIDLEKLAQESKES